MAWLSNTRNLFWTVGIALLALAIFGMQAWTAVTIDRRLNPQGTPLLINGMEAVGTPRIGQYFRVRLGVEKKRDCEAHAQMVYVNPAGEERPFRIETWPHVAPGAQHIDLWAQVPDVLQPGQFSIQVRGLWVCQEEYYPVTSPAAEIEIQANETRNP